ncbi:hypothetical protein CEXT_347691 [Caerostris extrusa]|uniref:Uncharacterized protein n=1 Tax=Caerostris extrusa TaxID=172846 RepID=A0AAV4SI70_CAEEX|nr:hypothetical protein CEXT_347691 [Caerostris extrusa]
MLMDSRPNRVSFAEYIFLFIYGRELSWFRETVTHTESLGKSGIGGFGCISCRSTGGYRGSISHKSGLEFLMGNWIIAVVSSATNCVSGLLPLPLIFDSQSLIKREIIPTLLICTVPNLYPEVPSLGKIMPSVRGQMGINDAASSPAPIGGLSPGLSVVMGYRPFMDFRSIFGSLTHLSFQLGGIVGFIVAKND